MNFKSFVPPPARRYVEETIQGSPDNDGLKKVLANANQRLSEVSVFLQKKLRNDGILNSDDIKKKNMAEAYRDQCAGDIAFLERLGSDLRMEAAYQELEGIFTAENEWRRFLHSCWGARINFHNYRERIANATDLSKEIAEQAEALALKMRTLDQVSTDLPLELHSIQALLRQTENHSLFDRNLEMWRIHRGVVLGDQPSEDLQDTRLGQRDTSIEKVVVGNEKTGDENTSVSEIDQYLSSVRYAWGLAPDFASLLFKVAEIMKDFSPEEHGYIGAGLASRESNEKTAYIRALYSLLSDGCGIEMSLPVRKAVASITTIALDHRDIEATLDDVTKAISSYEAKKAR
jgi:hypothetical protein